MNGAWNLRGSPSPFRFGHTGLTAAAGECVRLCQAALGTPQNPHGHSPRGFGRSLMYSPPSSAPVVGPAVTGLRKAVARLGNLVDERCNGSAWLGSYEGAIKNVSKARAEFVSVAHESLTGPGIALR